MAVACALGLWGPVAHAQPWRRARLTLGADPACATLSQLQQRVRAGAWQLVEDAKPEVVLVASVQPEAGDALRASLHVEWADGRRAARSLTAASCGAAVDALALLINMTLDTGAARSRRPAPAADGGGDPARGRAAAAERPAAGGGGAPAAAADGSSARAGVSGSDPPDAQGGDALEEAAGQRSEASSASVLPAADGGSVEAPVVAEDAHASDDAAGNWRAVTHVAVGGRAALGNATAPRLQPALGLYAALALRGVGWLRPMLQLELWHAWSRGLVAQGGRADFTWDGGQLSLCPVGVRWRAFAGHGCGALELGRISARGYETYAPRAQHRPWLALGASLLLTAAVWERIEVQLGAGLLRPVWRDQFAFAPQVFFAVPGFRFQLHLGLGVRFP